jgi:hypothetical protein
MDYEGKFRDFMVGWLADRRKEPGINQEEVEALYDAVVEVVKDRAALLEVQGVLGHETAQKLWELSEAWHDPVVEKAGEMIAALREQVQADTRDHTQFYLFFLNPFEEGCVPSGFEDRLEQEICWMFRVFYSAVGEAVLAPHGWQPDVVVEPSYEDSSNITVLAHPREDYFSKVFVYQSWYKAWHLHFDSLAELAEELLRLRKAIEPAAPKAIQGYHLTQAAAEVKGAGGPTENLAQSQALMEFADRVAVEVTNLNGLISSIVNEEITPSDFNNDLTQLFNKLTEVEGAVRELTNVFWR